VGFKDISLVDVLQENSLLNKRFRIDKSLALCNMSETGLATQETSP
jgi:hypothetical protein